MKSKLENFEVFICDKCCEIIMIKDAFSLSMATNHALDCICNKEIMEQYNKELDECITDEDLFRVHEKYTNILYS